MADRLPNNLFAVLPSALPEELVTVLAENQRVRIERIASTGHSSPASFWYDQDEHEWAVVLKGEAKLLFEDGEEPSTMQPGDHVLIPAHRKHRVEWTTAVPAVRRARFLGLKTTRTLANEWVSEIAARRSATKRWLSKSSGLSLPWPKDGEPRLACRVSIASLPFRAFHPRLAWHREPA